jgi:hypothetical protein
MLFEEFLQQAIGYPERSLLQFFNKIGQVNQTLSGDVLETTIMGYRGLELKFDDLAPECLQDRVSRLVLP